MADQGCVPEHGNGRSHLSPALEGRDPVHDGGSDVRLGGTRRQSRGDGEQARPQPWHCLQQPLQGGAGAWKVLQHLQHCATCSMGTSNKSVLQRWRAKACGHVGMHMLPSDTSTFTLIVAVHVVTSLWRGEILQAICLHWRLRKLL
jgi:hypothetical protein